NDVLVVKADVVQPELAKSASDKVVEVKNEKPQERLLPFIASVVLEVDLKAQTMLVDWDEDF
ncbi:MAG TPA: ribosome maturation factor RimM, partial [Methylotenera sp.]|nr:ribosome maturation factor RimM [Methylotenera sp.]